jgi:hypothetical protein
VAVVSGCFRKLAVGKEPVAPDLVLLPCIAATFAAAECREHPHQEAASQGTDCHCHCMRGDGMSVVLNGDRREDRPRQAYRL